LIGIKAPCRPAAILAPMMKFDGGTAWPREIWIDAAEIVERHGAHALTVATCALLEAQKETGPELAVTNRRAQIALAVTELQRTARRAREALH
jgi:hypothetical protein